MQYIKLSSNYEWLDKLLFPKWDEEQIFQLEMMVLKNSLVVVDPKTGNLGIKRKWYDDISWTGIRSDYFQGAWRYSHGGYDQEGNKIHYVTNGEEWARIEFADWGTKREDTIQKWDIEQNKPISEEIKRVYQLRIEIPDEEGDIDVDFLDYWYEDEEQAVLWNKNKEQE